MYNSLYNFVEKYFINDLYIYTHKIISWRTLLSSLLVQLYFTTIYHAINTLASLSKAKLKPALILQKVLS